MCYNILKIRFIRLNSGKDLFYSMLKKTIAIGTAILLVTSGMAGYIHKKEIEYTKQDIIKCDFLSTLDEDTLKKIHKKYPNLKIERENITRNENFKRIEILAGKQGLVELIPFTDGKKYIRSGCAADVTAQIKQKTGKTGLFLPNTDGSGGWIFMNLAWSFGTDFVKEENGNIVSAFNTPECVKALQYIKDLKWKYDALPESQFGDNDFKKAFAEGDIAMGFFGTSEVDENTEYVPDRLNTVFFF